MRFYRPALVACFLSGSATTTSFCRTSGGISSNSNTNRLVTSSSQAWAAELKHSREEEEEEAMGDRTNLDHNNNNQHKETNEIPLLPPSTGDDPTIPSIKLGESIRFEEWGPIILNTDGTTRRIANWDEMTAAEQAVTWRRISKRNEERRLVLLEQMKQNEQQQEQAQDKEL